MTPGIADFLLARIAEDEAVATNRGQLAGDQWSALEPDRADDVSVDVVGRGRGVVVSALRWEAEHIARWDPARVLAECDAKREVIRLHESWPVLVEGPVEFDPPDTTITGLTMRVTRRMAWLTGQEYRARFGSEPPTTPMLRALALPYADHPDYDEAWRP